MKYIDSSFQPAPYYVEKHKYIGQINVPDGSIDITDPCYDQLTWCAMFDFKVKPGIYKCYINIINFPSIWEVSEEDLAFVQQNAEKIDGLGYKFNDARIMQLEIIHEDDDNGSEMEYECVSQNIGVDAGLCGFYNHKPDYTEDCEWYKFCENLSKLDNGCTCNCEDNGITVSSGFGDGCYLLSEARNKNNEVVALKLNFDDDQDMEESYADEEE